MPSEYSEPPPLLPAPKLHLLSVPVLATARALGAMPLGNQPRPIWSGYPMGGALASNRDGWRGPLPAAAAKIRRKGVRGGLAEVQAWLGVGPSTS